VTCDVEVNGDCEGILYTRGSHNVGHAFFIKDRKLQFVYNALGRHYRATGDLDLSSGVHELGANFEREGRSGRLALTVNGREIGSTKVGTIVRMPGSTGVDVGRNGLSPLVDDYEPPFAFTGSLKRITFDIKGRGDPTEVEATARTEMGKE
jgi:arylsulfatase